MKKVILCALPLLLTACSSPVQQSSVPMDMQAVQEYQQRVQSGKTNTQSSEHWELNQSDKRPKVQVIHHRPRIQPSVHYGYGWGHRHYSGVGVGFGGY